MQRRAPLKTKTLFPRLIGEYKIKLKDLIIWWREGRIQPYENNRGNGKVSGSMVNEIANNFDVNALVKMHFGLFKSTVPEIPNPYLKICDGHSRMKGILKAYTNKKLQRSDLESSVTIKVISPEDFLIMYTKLNTVASHTARHKLLNKDLSYGEQIYRIFNKLPNGYKKDASKYIKGRSLANLSYIIAGLSKKWRDTPNWNYADLFLLRSRIKEDLNKPAGEVKFNITTGDFNDLVDAVIFYINYRRELDKRDNTNNTNQIKMSASWFGVIMLDLLSQNRKFATRCHNLANQTIRNSNKLNGLIKGITYGTKTDTLTTIMEISRIIKIQKRSIA